MGDTGYQEVTLSGTRFASQLLRSHLQIASIGLLVVLVALIAIFVLQAKISTIINGWEPIDRSGSKIFSDVQGSIAGLRGLVALRNPDHIREWKQSWDGGVYPSLTELQNRLTILQDFQGLKIIDKLRPQLRELYISQWQVKDIALTPGNEPARIVLLFEMQQVTDELNMLLKSLGKQSHERNVDNHMEHLVLVEIDKNFNTAYTSLKDFADHGLQHNKSKFYDNFQLAQKSFSEWDTTYPPHSLEQQKLRAIVKREFQVIATVASKIISLRRSERWNVAQFLMKTETAPLAKNVLHTISNLLLHAREMMDQHSREATMISRLTIITLLLLVAGMTFMAIILSKRRAQTLTKPVWNLVQGAQKLADGKLDRDIMVTTDDELSVLTKSFNSMRHSLEQYHQKLAATNSILERRAADLSEANKELRDFVYIISHDLRSPLLSVQGFMEELQMDLDELDDTMADIAAIEEPKQRQIHDLLKVRMPEDMEYIRVATEKMDGLINAILKLSRLGRSNLQFEQINLQTMVEENIKASAHMIRESGITVTVGKLPNLVSDRTAMEQIIGNLFANAIKYLDSERPGQINISGIENLDRQTISIVVEDNGRGISSDDIPKIYSLFQRVGKQDRDGEGIGLSYVTTLLKRLDGKISCESTLGQGTRFCVVLPMAPVNN